MYAFECGGCHVVAFKTADFPPSSPCGNCARSDWQPLGEATIKLKAPA